MENPKFLLCFVFLVIDVSSVTLDCSPYKERNKHIYGPTRHCQRSNMTVIGWQNFNTAQKCMEFAKSVKGMAINFSPTNRRKRNRFENKTKSWRDEKTDAEEVFFSCQVLNCPEFRNFSTMINDTRYDYYSLYAFPPPLLNTTCVPYVGVFLFVDQRENYTQAMNVCLNHGGSLAHILTQQRTNSLSLLVEDHYKVTLTSEVFVGLNETWQTYNSTSDSYRNSGRSFITATQEPIQCFRYRAWAPGYPKFSFGPRCVTITRSRSWKTTDCATRLPFICEINTSGPDERVSLKGQCHLKRPNNKDFWREVDSEEEEEDYWNN